MLLALYHEEQEKVFEEVSHVLPNDPNEITSYDECVPKLACHFADYGVHPNLLIKPKLEQVYTRGVIQESLRLFPAAFVASSYNLAYYI